MSNNGSVIWVPPTEFQTFCDLNLKYWPFDSHDCHLILGSWTYNGNEIDIVGNMAHAIMVEVLVQNYKWEITKSLASRNIRYYSCCTEPYVDIEFNITIQRRSPMYKAVVITPASMIVLMTLASFWLPCQAGEKILLNGVTAIIIVIFLIYFAHKLPAMASHTPLIGIYFYTNYVLGQKEYNTNMF